MSLKGVHQELWKAIAVCTRTATKTIEKETVMYLLAVTQMNESPTVGMNCVHLGTGEIFSSVLI